MKLGKNILVLIPGFPKDEDDFLCVPPMQNYFLKYKEICQYTKFTVFAFQYPFEKRDYNWNGKTFMRLVEIIQKLKNYLFGARQ